MDERYFALHRFAKASQELDLRYPAIPVSTELLGQFHNDALVVEVGYTKEETDASLAYLSGLTHLTPKEQLFGLYEPNRIDIEKALPALTFWHEHEHFLRFQSTVCGLYTWRLMHALSVDVSFMEVLKTRGLYSGRIDLISLVSLADEFEHKYKAGFDIADLKSKGDYTLFVAWEICILRLHLINMLDGRGLSKGQFVRVAQAADALLSLRSETAIERTIVTDAPDQPLVGEDDLTFI